MVASIPDAVIVLGQDFQLDDINPAAARTLGVTVTEVRGQRCTEVLGCQNLNHITLCGTPYCPLTRVMQQGEPIPNEDLIIGTKPGHSREVSASVASFQPTTTCDDRQEAKHNGNLESPARFAVFTARDLTAVKVANQVRSNFLSMVSHELRTPLNSVHGFLDLIVQGHMGPLNEEQKLYLNFTQKGVQQLLSIVEDILFMTRSDLGQFQVRQEPTPLRALIRQVVSGLQPQLRKAEVVLRQEIATGLLPLFIDPQRIIQVLNNLIVNAIKFTPPGGIITVKAQQYDARSVIISVTDTGMGIQPEDQQHVFERFYQSNHQEQSKMGGYGLGLAIVKLIVEQHGGTIGLESTAGKGTTFYFTMPVYKKSLIKHMK
jgi:two-component system phosphate regulon sensor histidine kinase PhoR